MTTRRHIDHADNRSIADALERVASLLEQGDEDVRYRANAWRRAGEVIRRLDVPVARLARQDGLPGLERLPRIGQGIGRAILELVETGRLGLLAKLEERAIAEGVTPALSPRPDVAVLLDVDREYREKAGRDELKKIAPARFNPEHDAWLPLLHTTRGEWKLTALFSNTERAHERGATHDWVVIYAKRPQEKEQQWTVVTEERGPLAGERVVRGREEECAELAWRGRVVFW